MQQLYAELRAPELAFAPWTDDVRAAFASSQFALQHRHLTTPGIATDFWIVEVEGHAAGRLYAYRTTPCWRLVEIALTTSARGRGIGSLLIAWLQSAARAAGASGIGLSVLNTNTRAALLYARHGFVGAHGDSTTHRQMIWRTDG